uniref:Secreted protein n=1 Tax=Mycena chlorophos TaxID=658473 RepID=A0ABQ0L5A3_MYCCL|nr:predicted protein [Mycena chlorophos]
MLSTVAALFVILFVASLVLGWTEDRTRTTDARALVVEVVDHALEHALERCRDRLVHQTTVAGTLPLAAFETLYEQEVQLVQSAKQVLIDHIHQYQLPHLPLAPHRADSTFPGRSLTVVLIALLAALTQQLATRPPHII